RRDRKTPAALNLCFLMVTFRNTTPAGEAQSKSEADVSLQEPLLLGGTDKRDWRADGWGRPACDRTPCGQRCAGAAGWLWVDCGGPLDATALAGLAWLERIGVGSAANILGLQGLGGAWACRPRVLALRVGYLPGVGSVRGGGPGKREAGGAARASSAGAVCEALLALCGLGICAGVPAARVFPAKAGSDTGEQNGSCAGDGGVVRGVPCAESGADALGRGLGADCERSVSSLEEPLSAMDFARNSGNLHRGFGPENDGPQHARWAGLSEIPCALERQHHRS